VQLRFPICAGVSASDAYRAATRRGVPTGTLAEATGLALSRPNQLSLTVHPTLAGRVPVLVAPERDDFVSLVRALAWRNEPAAVPDSQGACLISGLNNWDRIRQLRSAWEATNPFDRSEAAWQARFHEEIIPQKELYQDCMILLTAGPYSNVAAADLGMSESAWRDASLVIRREHECAHYVSRRVLGQRRWNLLDELIADYRGIVAATGHFRADWFLRFMGLENFPTYRPGGRLENYRGDPPMSEKAFEILQTLVKRAAEKVERFDHEHAEQLRTPESQIRALIALTRMTLVDLASDEGSSQLNQAFA
jgi:hypothetical protein